MDPSLKVQWLGRRPYREVHDLQQGLLVERIQEGTSDMLLLVEHYPVVTLGRGTEGGAADYVMVPVIPVERGGEATYHGPGQLVAYPIRELLPGHRDLHAYLRSLEDVVIDVLADFGVVGGRIEGKTGVWIEDRKVASIGVAVRRWVTWHGVAINVTTDLEQFASFRPCGSWRIALTRLADHAKVPCDLEAVGNSFQAHFARRFGYDQVVLV